MKNLIIVIAAILASVLTVNAQKNQDVCRVTTDTRSISGGYGTGIYEVGKFPVDAFDEVTRKSFRYETDGKAYVVNVEIGYGDYKDIDKGKPSRLMLSLNARLAETDEKSVLPVEAWTSYGKQWGTVSLSTHVVTGNNAQHFGLTCSDGISKFGVKRGDPDWLKKAKSKTIN